MPRFARSVVVPILGLLLIFPVNVYADTNTAASCEEGSAHAYLSMTTVSTPWDGCTVVMAPSFDIVEVWAYHVPAKKIRFSIQNPSFGTIAGESYNFPHTGTATTGVELDLGGCQPAGNTLLGTLIVVESSGTIPGCVAWTFDSGCEIVDCNDAVRPAIPRPHDFANGEGCCFYIDCPSLPPYDLFPPDGAIEVPLDVTLSWTAPALYINVEISDDPACYSGQSFFLTGVNSFSPDFLQPNTTYHWQVGWGDGLECGAGSPLFSFKTIAPVATEEETWGRIKALYK